MRSNVLKACLSGVVLLAACGAPEVESPEVSLANATQAVLHPPLAPASGNILDSTTFMGSVSIPGAVQTRFTTNPQFFSFNLNAPAGAQVKLEVTHLGSSMYLDTGLFVYGPKDATGSYGTMVLAQDDDAGYGQLSKLAALSLTEGGDYLVVVSSDSGSGKQFRLQVDCLNGQCGAQQAPTGYALPLVSEPVASNVQTALNRVNASANEAFVNGVVLANSFAWSYAGLPTLDMATAAVEQRPDFQSKNMARQATVTYEQFEQNVGGYRSVAVEIRNAYSNGTETASVARYWGEYIDADEHSLSSSYYVIHFPESRKVIEFEYQRFE